MPFQRFVETGRVAYIADGPYKGKLCCIVDVINQTKALVDGPETGVPRQGIRLNQLHLTKFRLRYGFTASTKEVRKKWKEANMDEKWANSAWSQKLENKKRRAELTDFDRFKLDHARKIRNNIRTAAYKHLLKQYRKTQLIRERKKAEKTGNKGYIPPKAKKGVAAKPKKDAPAKTKKAPQVAAKKPEVK